MNYSISILIIMKLLQYNLMKKYIYRLSLLSKMLNTKSKYTDNTFIQNNVSVLIS